jgi:hypothetical protein
VTDNRAHGFRHEEEGLMTVVRADARIVWLAWGAVVAQALFIGGWLVVGTIEGHGYSAGRHDISDLSALTAHHPWAMLTAGGIAGALTMAFAIWALRPALTVPGQRAPLSAWLVAGSLPALDNLGDVFFRIDCRAADAGCSTSDAAASWHGKAHLLVFAVAAVATIVAPFALAHRMSLLPGWQDLVRPARVFGVLTVAALVVAGALQGTGGQGWAQRVAAVLVPLGIVVLALRVRRLSVAGALEDAAGPDGWVRTGELPPSE